MNNTGNDKKKTEALTGYKKAVPIALASLAVFIAICFVSSGTGAFGQGVSYTLLGLFSAGAYLIPLLLVLHSVFFADDVSKGRVLSRAIFSVIATLIVSSIDYTVFFWGKEALFDPALFFTQRVAGGFVGGAAAFCITKIVGPIGLIILDVAVLLTYAIVFFGRKDSAARKALLAILEAVTSVLAAAEKKIKKNAENRKEAKAENKRLETERRHAEFLDDQFFDVDGNMDELRIRELNIHQTKDKKKSEKKPSLQTKVFNKSAVLGEDITESAPIVKKKPDFEKIKEENTQTKKEDTPFFNADHTFEKKKQSYGIDESADSVFTKDFDPFDFATGEKLVAKQSTKATVYKKKSGIDELLTPIAEISESDVEKQKRREELELKRQSYMARKIANSSELSHDAQGEKNEYQPPATVQSAHDFRTAPISTTMEFGEQKNEDTAGAVDNAPQKNVEFTVDNTPTHISHSSDTSAISVTYEKPEPEVEQNSPSAAEEDAEFVAEQVAARVLMNNPAYARSANKSTFTTVVHEDAPVEEKADESEIALPETEAAEPVFKPYTPPRADDGAPTADTPLIVDRTLVTERNLLNPTLDSSSDDFLAKEIERYSKIEEDADTADNVQENESEPITKNADSYSAPVELENNADDIEAPDAVAEVHEEVAEISTKTTETALEFTEVDSSEAQESSSDVTFNEGEATVFAFEDEDSADEDTDELIPEPEEETAAEETEEIPPEEQNPDVIKQRAMFPFLAAEDKSDEDTKDEPAEVSELLPEQTEEEEPEDNAVKQETEEMPPFETDDEPAKKEELKAAPLPVPVEEKPKKKDYSDYKFPPIDLLHLSTEQNNDNIAEEIQDNADKLIDTLASFGVTASIKGVDRGPRITRYEVVPAKGVKVSNIMNLSDDIALNLAADGIRMEAPIPGKSAVGVEIPNKKSSIVRLRELIETDDFKSYKSKTTVCMGKDVAGQPVFADIAKMPHALIAGATGMGKSVCINSLMLSILYKARPDEVKFIMIDPKQVEFTMYNGIPHLLVPVVTDVKQAAGTLMWAVEEMERRYGVLQEMYVRNIDAYNEKVAANPALGEPMSRIVIVIDEFAELIMQAKNPVESLIIRIAQKARAAGIHLLIGTQKPVKEVITGLIKSNIPSKFSCKVASNRDSILIFDAAGAEKLLDKGDMLVAFANSLKPLRVQSAFVADDEVESVMEYLKQSSDGHTYDEEVMEEIRRAADKCSKKGGGDHDDDDDGDESYGEGYLNDKQFLDAVEIAVNTGKISTSLIQRKLSIGYGKAAKFIDIMEDLGVVGEPNGSKPREVLMSSDEWHEKLARATLD